MDQAIIDDLKQFITATVLQSISELRGDVAGVQYGLAGVKQELAGVYQELAEVKQGILKLDGRMDDMDLKFDTILAATGERFDSHEVRIKRLETKLV